EGSIAGATTYTANRTRTPPTPDDRLPPRMAQGAPAAPRVPGGRRDRGGGERLPARPGGRGGALRRVPGGAGDRPPAGHVPGRLDRQPLHRRPDVLGRPEAGDALLPGPPGPHAPPSRADGEALALLPAPRAHRHLHLPLPPHVPRRRPHLR